MPVKLNRELPNDTRKKRIEVAIEVAFVNQRYLIGADHRI
jgi:hypothetical protein